jgi:hypothetical protein
MVNMSIDEGLVDRVRRGDYEVDTHAVAEAMIRRWSSTSVVLIADQALDEPAVASDEREPGAGPDVP